MLLMLHEAPGMIHVRLVFCLWQSTFSPALMVALDACGASFCHMGQVTFHFNISEIELSLQTIEDQTCQVPVDEAMQFAQHFDPAHQLPGETVFPLLKIGAQQPKVRSKHTVVQASRKESLKRKEKKKRKKRRK